MAHSHENSNAPVQFLVCNVDLLPRGRVLDIAMGAGRNAIYLAKMGFEVEEGPEIEDDFHNLALETGVSIRAHVVDLINKVFKN